MSFAVAALNADGETEIQDAECVNISYPAFYQDLNRNLFQNLSYTFLGIGRSDAVRPHALRYSGLFATATPIPGKAQHINIVVAHCQRQ